MTYFFLILEIKVLGTLTKRLVTKEKEKNAIQLVIVQSYCFFKNNSFFGISYID